MVKYLLFLMSNIPCETALTGSFSYIINEVYHYTIQWSSVNFIFFTVWQLIHMPPIYVLAFFT